MGLFSLFKANITAIKKQRHIEAAMKSGDNEKLKTLIAESISEILRAGLTKNQLSILETIKTEHGELLNQLLSQAFQRGWTRSGVPNLSNAMDEVLKAAQEAIKEYRDTMT